jgi:hypothetical protein
MRVPVETLIDGLVRTLTEAVLPDVTTRFARGQLYAVVDVLRNLRDRIEVRAALAEAESASAAEALARAARALRDGGAETAAARLEEAVARAPEAPRARAEALRTALVIALELTDELPPVLADAARIPLREHLAAQTLRDLAVLKQSMLAEISRG